jgi:hypothetical protein
MAIFRNDLIDFGNSSLEHFLKQYDELLSCYRLENSPNAPDGLVSLMTSVSLLEPDSAVARLLAEPDFNGLDEPLQFRKVLDAMDKSLSEIFIKLHSRSALDRICILREGEELPQPAMLQLAQMKKSIKPEAVPAKPAPSATVPEPVQLSDEDACIQDFYQMGSTAFAAKWIRHAGRHQVFKNVSSRGRI